MYERKLEGLTLSGLLNCLDGVIAPEGRLTFFTTNYVKRLPSRLLRPGRVDRRFTFGPATLSQVGRMWERFFPLAPETAKQEFLNAVFPVAKTPPFVMAQVQQYLLLYRDSWEEGLDNRNRFHEIVKPVEGTNE
jgi:mitochondrial chaperone BCS1